MKSYSEHRDSLEEMLTDRAFAPYVTQWIDYQANHQNRLKMVHDLRLKDGTELARYRPNANAWYKVFVGPGPERVTDDQVAYIRISLNQGWN